MNLSEIVTLSLCGKAMDMEEAPCFFFVCVCVSVCVLLSQHSRGREREIVEETKGWLAFIEWICLRVKKASS